MDEAVKSAANTARADEQHQASQRLASDIEAAVRMARIEEQTTATHKRVLLQQDFDLQLSIKDTEIRTKEDALSAEQAKLTGMSVQLDQVSQHLAQKDKHLAEMNQKLAMLKEELEEVTKARGYAEDEGRSYMAELSDLEGVVLEVKEEQDDARDAIRSWE
jgi:chromosome segregation ATPase